MKRKEKLVIQGNEFYVIDLDCLEKKRKSMQEYPKRKKTAKEEGKHS